MNVTLLKMLQQIFKIYLYGGVSSMQIAGIRTPNIARGMQKKYLPAAWKCAAAGRLFLLKYGSGI